MSDSIVYVSRITRLPLVSADGSDAGHVSDVVLDSSTDPPHVNGFVIGGVQRRQVFVSVGRIAEISPRGVRLQRASINLRQFELRDEEHLAVGELFKRRLGDRRIVDFGLRSVPAPEVYEVATVALAPARRLPGIRRMPEVLDWSDITGLFDAHPPVNREAAALGHLHPVQMAQTIRDLPLERRRRLAEALDDERLADLLEELPEDEQVQLIEHLDPERIGSVLDEMEADDAADLLGSLPENRQSELLEEMDPDEAAPVRRLLNYQPDTAGGLMTPEPIILSPQDTVSQALANLRLPDQPVPLATQVFVCMPPLETPTGRMLGVVGVQRLLREAPSKPLSRCIDKDWPQVGLETSDRELSRQLAAYDAVALPVIDESGRLHGAVTIDDVLDHMLPSDWREDSTNRHPRIGRQG